MPDVNYIETPEQKAERWLKVSQKYLDYCKTPGADPATVKLYREKFPFVAWLLDNPDLPAWIFFASEPPPIQPPPVSWEQESPGMTNPGTIVSTNQIYELLMKIARQIGVALVPILVLLAVPAALAQTKPITFAWDASGSTATPTHAITYNLYTCTDANLTQCTPHDAGAALELALPMSTGTTWLYATALWDAIEGHPEGGKQESAKSNTISVTVYPPPDPAGTPRIKAVTIAQDEGGNAILLGLAPSGGM